MAQAVGIDAAQSTILRSRSGIMAIALLRYDRGISPDGQILRLHQEDFA